MGTPVVLDAAGTRDPDGHALTYRWWFYPEAGAGIPGVPVASGPPPSMPPESSSGSPPAARGVREAPRVRIAADATARATVTPLVPGIAHVILEVTDAGTPSLTSYRRVILSITP